MKWCIFKDSFAIPASWWWWWCVHISEKYTATWYWKLHKNLFPAKLSMVSLPWANFKKSILDVTSKETKVSSTMSHLNKQLILVNLYVLLYYIGGLSLSLDNSFIILWTVVSYFLYFFLHYLAHQTAPDVTSEIYTCKNKYPLLKTKRLK